MGERGVSERGVEQVRLARVAGRVVDVLVVENRPDRPAPAAVVAAEQTANFDRGEQPTGAARRRVDIAQRAGPRRVRQEPALVSLDPGDAVELAPPATAVAAAEDARRLGSGQDRAVVERVDADAAEGGGGQSILDARPAPAVVGAAVEPVAVAAGQEDRGPVVGEGVDGPDPLRLEPERLEPVVPQPVQAAGRANVGVEHGRLHRPARATAARSPVATSLPAARAGCSRPGRPACPRSAGRPALTGAVA